MLVPHVGVPASGSFALSGEAFWPAELGPLERTPQRLPRGGPGLAFSRPAQSSAAWKWK